MSSIIFGPITSRRFGSSLGVDLSPYQKQCNFDCLYCELKGAKAVESAKDVPSPEIIVEALKNALKLHQNCDVITLTANGEPTLYPELKHLIEKIKALPYRAKLLILSNGSTIADPFIQKTLSPLDIVKLSLDCATQKCFKKLDRPHKSISLERIIEGMKQFRMAYHGELIIEILVVEGINDTEEEFKALNEVLQNIAPNRIDVGTIDRPPAYKVQGVSIERLVELSALLEGLHVAIAYKKRYSNVKQSFSEEAILQTLERRPQSFEDVAYMFDEQSLARISKLVEQEKVKVKKVAGVNFYTTH